MREAPAHSDRYVSGFALRDGRRDLNGAVLLACVGRPEGPAAGEVVEHSLDASVRPQLHARPLILRRAERHLATEGERARPVQRHAAPVGVRAPAAFHACPKQL